MSYLITHVIKIIINLPDCYLIFPHLQNYDFFQIWISLGKFKILQKCFPTQIFPHCIFHNDETRSLHNIILSFVRVTMSTNIILSFVSNFDSFLLTISFYKLYYIVHQTKRVYSNFDF